MKVVNCWNDLAVLGIKPLTGEACGLTYRILFDVTEQGKRALEKCFDVKLQLAEPWNGDAIGSIMLAPEMFVPVAIFALLEGGCSEVWRSGDSLIGIEPGDGERERQAAARRGGRRYAYQGTAGSRNHHEFSGRVV